MFQENTISPRCAQHLLLTSVPAKPSQKLETHKTLKMKEVNILDLLAMVAIKLKLRQINTFQAIAEYQEIFKELEPALADGVKARDTSKLSFRSEMVAILSAYEFDKIDIYTAIDKIVDCFTTSEEEE